MPTGLDPVFELIFSEALPAKSVALSAALVDGTQSPPEHIGTIDEAPAPLDIEAVARSFDTEVAAELYRQSMIGGSAEVPATLALRMMAKQQADCTSRVERGVKMANITRVRSMALEASRRHRDGTAGGAYQNCILAQVQSLNDLKST